MSCIVHSFELFIIYPTFTVIEEESDQDDGDEDSEDEQNADPTREGHIRATDERPALEEGPAHNSKHNTFPLILSSLKKNTFLDDAEDESPAEGPSKGGLLLPLEYIIMCNYPLACCFRWRLQTQDCQEKATRYQHVFTSNF